MRDIDRAKKSSVIKKLLPTVALVLALSMLLCSCGFLNAVYEINAEAEKNKVTLDTSGNDEATQETDAQINGSILNNISVKIEKEESTAVNGDMLTSAGLPYNNVSKVYCAVADSVVEITTETVQTSIWMGQYVSTGAGSGIIIDKSGLIVTNNHVIEGANNVTVRLTDGSKYEASLIGSDAAADLAILKINAGTKELCVAKLGCSSDLVVGEDVVAIGNPLGSLGGTLTTGIISATERLITVDGEEIVLLQTNAAINPGNSGGGLFNMAGQLIGIVNAKASGEDVEGLGFAIPIDYAYTVIEDLINYGYVRGVADHGLTLLDVTSQNLPTAYYKYGITSAGIIVLESEYSDDIKYGDRIVSVAGVEVQTSADIDRILKSYSVGDTVTVTMAREGQIVEAEITLREKIPDKVDFGS